MTKYLLDEMVLVKSALGDSVFKISGITINKETDGKVTIQYKGGDNSFHEDSIIGRVTLEKPRQRRRRKSKEPAAAQSLKAIEPEFPFVEQAQAKAI